MKLDSVQITYFKIPSRMKYFSFIKDPPTYEETAGTSGKFKSDFNPKYPVFRRATSYSSND